jgi:hypothetical protein
VSAAGLISAQSSPELLLQGRFGGAINSQTGLGSLPLLFSWPSSSVYTTFTGTSVNVTIAGSAPTTDSAGYNRFGFFVDQTQVAIESSTPNNSTIQWEMSGLGPGAHNLTSNAVILYLPCSRDLHAWSGRAILLSRSYQTQWS